MRILRNVDQRIQPCLYVQNKKYNLPVLPTTTIGSFPQSKQVRLQRALWKKGELSNEAYEKFIEEEIARWIKIQEDLDIDILVIIGKSVNFLTSVNTARISS